MLLEIRIFSFCEASFFHPYLSKPPHCPCIVEIFFTWPMWPFFCVKHAANFYPFWTCYPRGQHVYQDPPEFLPKNSQQAPTFRHCLLQLEDEAFICEDRVQWAVLARCTLVMTKVVLCNGLMTASLLSAQETAVFCRLVSENPFRFHFYSKITVLQE